MASGSSWSRGRNKSAKSRRARYMRLNRSISRSGKGYYDNSLPF